MDARGCLEHYRILDYPEMERMTEELMIKYADDAVILRESGQSLGVIPFVQEERGPRDIQRHYHDFLELVFVIDGEGEHVLDDVVFRISKGDIFFINNKAFHSFRIEEGRDLLWINFCFLPEFLEQTITLRKIESGIIFTLIEPFFRVEDQFRYKLTVSGPVFYRLLHLALAIVDAFNRSYPSRNDAVPELFKAFMIQLYEEYEKLGLKDSTVFRQRERIIREILRNIERSFLDDVKVDDLLQPVGLGRTKANELFKSMEGETIVRYINRKRVEYAAELLQTTDLDILAIALESGFNDLSYFNRTFKKVKGLTPSAFRGRGK